MFIVLVVHCQWSNWLKWSSCSTSCGYGNRKRTRIIVVEADHGGKKCTDADSESQSCKNRDCPGMVVKIAILFNEIILKVIINSNSSKAVIFDLF